VRLKGPSVLEHLSRVPPCAEKENSPILVQYIELMLENSQGSSARGQAAPKAAPKASCPAELSTIFSAIEDAQRNDDSAAQTAAVAELHWYRGANPRVDIEGFLESVGSSSQGFIQGVLDSSKQGGHTPPPAGNARTPLQNTTQAQAAGNDNVAKSYMSRLHTLQSRYGFKSNSPVAKESPVQPEEEPEEESTEDLTNKYKDRLKYLQDRYGFSKAGAQEEGKANSSNSGSVDVRELKERMKDLSASVGTPQASQPEETRVAPQPSAAPQDAAPQDAAPGSSVADLRARLNRVKGISS